ncbi:MAG: transcriptional regulator [Rhodospirillales bacterium]|nr:transcriptional regulator [Rhodospirillales bacterium]
MDDRVNPNPEADPPTEMAAVTACLLPGLSVRLYANGRARFEAGPTTDHLLVVRLGGTAPTDEGGWIDLLPAGRLGVWETEQGSTTLRFQVSPARLRATAEAMEAEPMMELRPQHRVRDIQIDQIAAAIALAVRDDKPLARPYGESLGTALLARVITLFSAGQAGSPKQQIPILSDDPDGPFDK